mmetsp:Transcript_84714/g.264994  ORF Transcript_84714/g.264994 Transcript_84714/m.264994 type:complete len:605 (-) Transcript_84714:166-1980(-)
MDQGLPLQAPHSAAPAVKAPHVAAVLLLAPTGLALLFGRRDLALLLRSNYRGLIRSLTHVGLLPAAGAQVPPPLAAKARALLAEGRRGFAAGLQLVWAVASFVQLAAALWSMRRDGQLGMDSLDNVLAGCCGDTPGLVEVILYLALLASLFALRFCSPRWMHLWALLPHSVRLASVLVGGSHNPAGEAGQLSHALAQEVLARIVLGSYTSCWSATALGAVHSALLLGSRRTSGMPERLTEELALGAGVALVLVMAERLMMHSLTSTLRVRELEKSHAAMSGMLGAVCDCVVQLGPDLRISGPSSGLANLLSHDEGETLIGSSFAEFLSSEEELERLRASFTLTAGHQVRALPIKLQNPSAPAKLVRARAHCATFEGLDGEPCHLLGLRAPLVLQKPRVPVRTKVDAKALVTRLLHTESLASGGLSDDSCSSDEEETDHELEDGMCVQVTTSYPLEVHSASTGFEARFGRAAQSTGFVDLLPNEADRSAFVRWLGTRASDALEGRSGLCTRYFGPVLLRPNLPHDRAAETLSAVLAVSLPEPPGRCAWPCSPWEALRGAGGADPRGTRFVRTSLNTDDRLSSLSRTHSRRDRRHQSLGRPRTQSG